VIGGWSAWGWRARRLRRRLAVALALDHARVVRRLVLDVAGRESQSCNTGCCPQHCQVNNWVAMERVLGDVRRRHALAQPRHHRGGGVRRQRVSDRSVRIGGVRRLVLRRQLRAERVVAVVGVLGDVRQRHALALAHQETAESCGGTCDVLSESDSCTANGGCCPVNCVWSAFGAWSGCSVTCGAGTQTRSRMLQSTAVVRRLVPGHASESQPCMQPACPQPPVDCEVSQWAQWSACTATCGATASKSRTRTTTRGGQRRHAVPVAERVGQLRLWLLPGVVHCVDVVVVVRVLGDVRQRHAHARAHGDDGRGVQRHAVPDAERQRDVLDGGVRHRLPAEHVVELEHVLATCGTGEQRRTRSVWCRRPTAARRAAR
jgi:hypothetical protein